MATYPIKMVQDETGSPFVPLTSASAVMDSNNDSLQTLLDGKYNIINNLTTGTAGLGVLDAYQGKLLYDMAQADITVIPGGGFTAKYNNGMYIFAARISDVSQLTWNPYAEVIFPSSPGFVSINYVGLTPENTSGTYTGTGFEYSLPDLTEMYLYTNDPTTAIGLNIIVIGTWK